MEYLGKIFYKVNQEHAKRIVLYLCQHRDREVGRDELRAQLGLTMTEFELEQKLHALVKADILEQGATNFDYQGVQDNIFDKVFRGGYQKDIHTFDPADPAEITNEYHALYMKAKEEYQALLGRLNQTKGQGLISGICHHQPTATARPPKPGIFHVNHPQPAQRFSVCGIQACLVL